MTTRVLSWGTFMCDIVAAGLNKVAEPGVIEYLDQGIGLRLGGHPVDLAIDLVRIGVPGSQVGFVSTIGTDVFGDFLLGEIGGYGLRAFVERVDGATGKTMILAVKGQDRLCHLDLGACMKMSLGHLTDAIERTKPEFFTLRPGYTSLDCEMAGLLSRMRNGVLRDTFILLDLCAPYKKPWSYYLPLLPYVDAVHGNSKEVIRAGGEETLSRATQKILSLGVGAVLLTKEADGAEIVTAERRVSQPAFAIDAVEPSGCGDAFCAGVIYSLMQRDRRRGAPNLEEAIEALLWGQAMGAAAATAVGCVTGVTRARVQHLLATQQDRLLRGTKVEITERDCAGRRTTSE